MPGSFIDSNILIYLASPDAAKAAVAEDVVKRGGTVSVQVLNEVANVARRKMGLSWTEVHDMLDALRRLLVSVPVSIETHDLGLDLAERYKLSIYDAMIVASAIGARCDTLWSEDMHHGLEVDGALRIRNPFRLER